MKKIIIGRNNACDIIIPDTSDLVSRKQAVLAFSLWGKMLLFDTSNNGTYVNGQKIESGKAVSVTRKDQINFAKVADLDWNDVKDPYRKLKVQSLIGAAILALAIGGIVWWYFYQQGNKEQESTTTNTEVLAPPRGETVTTVDTPKQQKPAIIQQTKHKPVTHKIPVAKQKPKGKKQGNEPSGKDVLDKNKNDNTPIVY